MVLYRYSGDDVTFTGFTSFAVLSWDQVAVVSNGRDSRVLLSLTSSGKQAAGMAFSLVELTICAISALFTVESTRPAFFDRLFYLGG